MKMLLAVVGREHRAAIKAHAERGDMRAQFDDRWGECAAWMARAELRVGYRVGVTVRKAEIESGARGAVEFVVRYVVA